MTGEKPPGHDRTYNLDSDFRLNEIDSVAMTLNCLENN